MDVTYMNHMGNDDSVVDAARVSFAKVASGYTKEDNERLIKYLAKHNHWTPFAHTAISLRVSAPVPIRTQAFKHKQGLVENEESRRYISGTPVLFVPETIRSAPEGSKKQGSGGDHPRSYHWTERYVDQATRSILLYEDMVADGVAPEQARFVLPQGVEVNWVWTGNLYAFANFYNKRTTEDAQSEVRLLASKVKEVIEPLYPVSWKELTK